MSEKLEERRDTMRESEIERERECKAPRQGDSRIEERTYKV